MSGRRGVQQDPWRVRVHDRSGRVLGAGILLSDFRVLTCAHVLGQAGSPPRSTGDSAEWPMRVDLLGWLPAERRLARTVSGCCVPARTDAGIGSAGDVALLELDRAPGSLGNREPGAQLRGLAVLRDRPVRICGFPASRDEGMWLEATTSGPSGEWVQLNTGTDFGAQVAPGFSGAGVLDQETGSVIGMVMAKAAQKDRGVFWMLPVEDVAAHLPSIKHLIVGDPAADPSFLVYQESALDGTETDAMRTVAEAMHAAGAGLPVVVVCDREDDRAAAFGWLVARADLGVRNRMTAGSAEDAPPGTIPRAGSIDVAIDATGMTTGQVCQRIAARLGIVADSPASLVGRLGDTALAIVVDSADNAAEPDALFNELLFPLASAGAKVVVGARSLPAIAENRVSSVRLGAGAGSGPLGAAPDLVRMDRLDGLVERVRLAEDAAREIAPRILGAPQVPCQSDRLLVRVAQLRRLYARRRQPASCEDADVLAVLDAAQDRAVRALRDAQAIRQELDALLVLRNDLRGSLDNYRVMANAKGFAEDIELARLYTAAHQTLWCAPCDLAAARVKVTAYLHAVWRRLGLDGEGAAT
jgi:hypothetical protein